jgi:uncharacterized protein YfaS (alpha-2-macroglobulin family)
VIQSRSIPFVLLWCVLFWGCSRSDQSSQSTKTVKPIPDQLISAVSSGEVSRFDTIRIVFAQPIKGMPTDFNPDPNASSYLRFQPNILGEAIWRTSSVLEFKPSEPLASGEVYRAFVDMSRLFPKLGKAPDGVPDFQFYTPRRALQIRVGAASSPGYDLKEAVIEGFIETSDREQSVGIESLLSATQQGRGLAINWEHSGKQHRFKITGVQRQEQDSKVMVRWNGGIIGVNDFKGTQEVEVPARSQFRFLSAEVKQEPGFQIVLTFSDPLKRDQDLRGLIKSPKVGMSLRISGNRVIASPYSPVSGEIALEISGGLRNAAGYALGRMTTHTLRIDDLKPALRLVNHKTIISDQELILLPFEAVNVKAVDVRVVKVFSNNLKQFYQTRSISETYGLQNVGRPVLDRKIDLDTDQQLDLGNWNRHVLNLSDLIQTDPGAIYNVTLAFRKDYVIYGCREEEPQEEANPYASEPELWSYYETYKPYSWANRDNPCHATYYRGDRNMVRTNIYASNIGLMAKYADSGKDLWVAVNDIQSAQPLANVEVKVFDKVHQELAVARTDKHGMVYFADLAYEPYLVYADRGIDEGYLALREGTALSMSRFDVGGLETIAGVNGFLYGERGVWRPGDDIYLVFILEDPQMSLPEGHPVVLEFRDPRGRLVTREVVREATGNFYRFDLKTDADAPTGSYRATVMVGGSRFDKVIRVETVRPNRLKLKLDLGDAALKAPGEHQAKINVNWLHGAPLRNGKVDVKMRLRSVGTHFDGFQGVTFDDPSRNYTTDYLTVFEGQTNQEGTAKFSFKTQDYREAPGRMQGQFAIKAFEPGGAFSSDYESVMVDPFDVYVGLRLPERDRDWNVLHSDQTHSVEVFAVSADGTALANQTVDVSLYKLSWRWWWDRDNGRSALHQARMATTAVIRETVTTDANGRAIFELDVDDDVWGRYFLRTSHADGHAAGETFYMYRRGWSMPSDQDEAGAAMLSIKAEQDKVFESDVVSLQVPSSPRAMLLLSVEQGDEVLFTRWVASEGAQTQVTFQATAEMVPNVYASITMLQPNDDPENDLPIRMYGVVPITVEDQTSILEPVLAMADVLEPETEAVLKVSEANGQPMNYTIAMVDEGLLDLTPFQTPNPRQKFFAKRALGIQTWDLYNHVQGAFGDQFRALLAVGGGAARESLESQKAKRFPPMVQFLGPFQLEADATAEHRVIMPAYVGSVRTMVIAGRPGAYGAAQKTTPVRKPLMVLGSLPRVLTPDETLDMPVTLFAMEPGIGEVTVSVKGDDRVRVLQPEQKVTLADAAETTLRFPLLVSQVLGVANLEVVATSANNRATYSVEIDVRSPNPMTTEISEATVAPGSSQTLSYEPLGLAGSHQAWLEVSAIPAMNVSQRLDDLIRYPYGCIEQTTSAVFPQLRLSDLSDMDDQAVREVAANITRGIRRIANFQLYNGGLSYWPGGVDVSSWGSLYAGHFMLAARDAGYTIPPDFVDRWSAYQQLKANGWMAEGNRRFQAYRLYLLALAGKPEMGAMNRFREVKDLPDLERWLLATAYALAGQGDFARELASQLSVEVADYNELGGSYGSALRDQSLILLCMAQLGLEERAANLATAVADRLNQASWLSTQSAAFALVGMAAFANLGEHQLDFQVQFAPDQQIGTQSSKVMARIPLPDVEVAWPEMTLRNRGERRLFTQLVRRGIPGTNYATSGQQELEQSVVYKDEKGKAISPEQLPQGRDFYVEVTVRNPNRGVTLEELALAHMVPGGWEIHNPRLSNQGPSGFDTGEYQDFRDDRIFTFFDLRPQESKTFRIMVNAAFQGRFYLPSIRTEAMYDHRIYAQQAGGWVNVVVEN